MAKKPHFKLKTHSGVVTLNNTEMVGHYAVANQAFARGGFNGWLPNPDPILKRLGKDISVYRELLGDAIVGGHVRRRKASVAGLDWRLDGEDVPSNVMDIIDATLSGLDIYQTIKDILNAPFYGYQPIEIIWHKDSLWLPEKLVAKPQEWFTFNQDNELCFISNGNLSGEPVPPVKFLCPTQEASYTNPYGQGDLAMVFWPTTFRRAGLKFWAEFTEKYGAPWLIGKEPRSNQASDTNKLLDCLEALIGNSVGTIPNDSSVEIHEASGKSSSVEAYDKLIRMCRSETAIALLGQDQTTDKDSTNASAQAGLEVTEDIRDSDKRIVESTFNQLIDYICDLNFGDVERPVFELFVEEAGDQDLAARDKTLTECGVRFTQSYFKRAYNLSDEDIESVEKIDAKPITADFAESEPVDLDTGLVSEAHIPDTDVLNAQGQALTAVLATAIKDGAAEDSILDVLVDTYPDMDENALQDELERLFFLADLIGRLEVQEELAR